MGLLNFETAIVGSLTAFVVVVVLVRLLMPWAPRMALIDRPQGRKQHLGNIPMIGGLAIFIAYVFTLFVTGHIHVWGWAVLFVWTTLVALGLWNDIRHVPVWVRVGIQVSAIVTLCLYTGIQLKNLGDLTGNGPVILDKLALPVTILGLIGVKNGINLIDGLDGLAGTQVLCILAWFMFLSLQAGHTDQVLMMLPLAGAVAGFLAYNLRLPGRPAVVFLGDHGSVFLGFTLGWFAVIGSQGDTAAFTPIEAVWVLGVPILDTIRVMLSRIARAVSPFSPGRDHLHHLLLDRGLSVNTVVVILLALSLLCGSVVWIGRLLGFSEVLLLCMFLTVSLLFFLAGLGFDRERLAQPRHRS